MRSRSIRREAKKRIKKRKMKRREMTRKKEKEENMNAWNSRQHTRKSSRLITKVIDFGLLVCSSTVHLLSQQTEALALRTYKTAEFFPIPTNERATC